VPVWEGEEFVLECPLMHTFLHGESLAVKTWPAEPSSVSTTLMANLPMLFISLPTSYDEWVAAGLGTTPG
jgi:hypothetical protein